MHIDKRTESRSPVTRQPVGMMQLVIGESCFNVASVIDLSTTGIRLKVSSKVRIGENIWVRYLDDKVDLKFSGTVAWISDPIPDAVENQSIESHLIGIELATPSLLEAVLLT